MMYPLHCRGRARLATKPTPTGSLLAPRTMGMGICGPLGCKSGGCSGGHDDIDLPLHKVGREILQTFVVTFRVPALDDDILPFHITEFLKLTCKGDVEIGANAGIEQANPKLLRGACGEGPYGGAADKSDKCPSPRRTPSGLGIGKRILRIVSGPGDRGRRQFKAPLRLLQPGFSNLADQPAVFGFRNSICLGRDVLQTLAVANRDAASHAAYEFLVFSAY